MGAETSRWSNHTFRRGALLFIRGLRETVKCSRDPWNPFMSDSVDRRTPGHICDWLGPPFGQERSTRTALIVMLMSAIAFLCEGVGYFVLIRLANVAMGIAAEYLPDSGL